MKIRQAQLLLFIMLMFQIGMLVRNICVLILYALGIVSADMIMIVSSISVGSVAIVSMVYYLSK